MNVLVLGKNGQLAQSLLKTAPSSISIITMGRDEIDITNSADLESVLRNKHISCIINTAAYTAVDKAENEPEQAQRLNNTAAQQIALAAANCQSDLLHISTDFVFDGFTHSAYTPQSTTNPINIYGKSKRQGELAVLSVLPSAKIIRTSWVFSEFGQNFVKTMLKLMTEKSELKIVHDQIGSPSSAQDLADFIWYCVTHNALAAGIHHWTNAGLCSWYDFAVAIQRSALNIGLLSKTIPILPIPSSEYPTPAKRPTFSVLDKTSSWQAHQIARHWLDALDETIQTIAKL